MAEHGAARVIIEQLAVCPMCRGGLDVTETAFRCAACDVAFPIVDGQPDLRPQHPVTRSLTVELDPLHDDAEPTCRPLPAGPFPIIEYDPKLLGGGNRLSPMLGTHLPSASANDLLLDLGCGDPGPGRLLAEARGYTWVGGDAYSPKASVLVDGHTLPFPDRSIAACCSFATLEHVRVPQLLVQEVARVLRPGGVFLGSVAFLETHHGGSVFHFTHIGTFDVLTRAGFDPVLVEANSDWRGTDAMFRMHAEPRVPLGRYLGKAVVRPTLRFLTRTTARRTNSHADELHHVTAGFRFVATRSAP